jgi:hypothetical protein
MIAAVTAGIFTPPVAISVKMTNIFGAMQRKMHRWCALAL